MANLEDTSVALLRMPYVGDDTHGPSSIYSVTYTPSSYAGGGLEDNVTTVTLEGVNIGDYVSCMYFPVGSSPVFPVRAYVTAPDTVTVTFYSADLGEGTAYPEEGIYKFLVIKAF